MKIFAIMRKHILLIIALCLHIAARGQTIVSLDDIDLSGLPKATSAKALRYWIDDDAGSLKTTTQLNGQLTLDVSALLEGLHTLHYQVIDENDNVTSVNSALFMKMNDKAIGTEAKQLRYWFDDDASTLNTIMATGSTQSLDVSNLIDGLHTVHYQVVGNDNAAYHIVSALFMKMNDKAIGTEAKQLRYWFDDNANTLNTSTATGSTQVLDVSNLIDGLHTVHYQVVGSDNAAYHIVSSLFMKMGTGSDTNITARKLMYWFDDEATITTVDVSEGVQMLDASRLIDGLHTIHYQVLCSNGMLTSASSSLFMRMNIDAEATTAKQLRYWFDDAQTAVTTNISTGTTMLDASQLIDGLHTVHYQIVDSRGLLGAPASSIFMKMDAAASSTQAQRLRYWFDDDTSTLKIIDVSKGTQTLDVSELLTGLHTLCYQLVDSEGKVSTPYTRLFMKAFDKVVPDGENRVTKYQYWLNKNSQAMQTVTLDNAANPYQLISLIPMQKEPIQSECFHFEVAEGQPMVYAKNIFHIRFHDAAGYFADGDKTFVDYGVKQEINAELLESGIRATTAKPEENTIKWYCLQAEPGDSLQFKLDRAATIQLFSPSGEEIFTASGAESVKWGGLHVYEAGTFYLALHDVTAKQGTTVGIDYNHIDKYAVLRQDVSIVGNGGCSTITFEGNGFKNLYAVDIFTEHGDSIHHVDIGHESDATTSVTFDFSGAIIGNYNAKFYFADEDRMFNNMITVEESKDIELETTVTYPSTFLRGTSVTYTVNITNKGNMTAYNVPLELLLQMDSINDVAEILFDGCLKGMSIPEVSGDLDEEDMIILKDVFRKYANDKCQFIYYHDSISNREYGLSQIFLTLPPNQSQQFEITIMCYADVSLYAVVTKEWFPLNIVESMSKSRGMQKADRVSKFCCVKEKWQCAADIIASIAGIAGGHVNCAGSIGSAAFNTAADIWCTEGKSNSERVNNYVKSNGASLSNRVIHSVVSCFTGYLGPILKNLRKMRKEAIELADVKRMKELDGQIAEYKELMGNSLAKTYKGANTILSGAGCLRALTLKKPGCPPNPGGGGGTSEMRNSCEPNDMLGYTAESGSKAIKDGLTDIWYTIQFENDTVFATAPAHDIYLTDTLDVNLFDLTTYRPTKIKIGEKSMDLTGERNFISTMDMRPQINAIAQIEGTIDDKTGIVRWHISSLDPMTMEPIQDALTGVLPVNFDGSGLGEASYDISLKKDLPHGTVIKNRSGNIFDSNETVLTPTYTNIIDRISPESHVANVQMMNDSTAAVKIEATDELSGAWRYDVYVQYGKDAGWWKAAENVPIDTMASVKVYEGIDHGFYVVVTDSAGNVEQKNAEREYTLEIFNPQIETNTQIALSEGWNWMSHNQNIPMSLDAVKSSATRIVGQTKETIKDTRFGWVGDLDELMPTQMYKLQMKEAANIQCSGLLFNAAFRSVPLYEGWNWIGYPVANVMSLNEALSKFEAEEGDFLIGQDGMATYSDGQWVGTLTEMQPGKGYMYRSMSYKNLFYNASAQSSSRAAFASRTRNTSSDEWSVNKHKYPNVMAIVASLSQDDEVGNAEDCVIAAFCGDECRGVAKTVDGVLMMNVYGNGKESINFYAMNRDTEEVLKAKEEEVFKMDVLGTMNSPYELHFGKVTGITEHDGNNRTGSRISSVYDMQGRRINVNLSSISDQLKKGIYIVTDENNRTKKIVGR